MTENINVLYSEGINRESTIELESYLLEFS